MTEQINKLQSELDVLTERITDTERVTSNGLVELTRLFREKQEKLDAMKDALAKLAQQKWNQHNSTLTNSEIQRDAGTPIYGNLSPEAWEKEMLKQTDENSNLNTI